MKYALFSWLMFSAGCTCNGGHSFVLVIPGEVVPDSAWITVSGTEHPLVCSYIDLFEEVHCDAPSETDDVPVEEVSSVGFVMGEERLEADLNSVSFEDGGECGRGGHYFFEFEFQDGGEG